MKIERAGRYERADGRVQPIVGLFRCKESGCFLAGGPREGVLLGWEPETGKPYAPSPEFRDEAALSACVLTEYLGPLEPGDDGFAKEREA